MDNEIYENVIKTEYGVCPMYRRSKKSKIYWIQVPEAVGLYLFTFDKKKVYNFFSDFYEMSEEEKAIFKKEEPTLYRLKSKD